VLKVDFKEAVAEIRKIIGTCDVSKPQPEAKVSRELLRKIYIESKPIQEGDPVVKYLRNRGLSVMSDKLRYHPECYEPETHTKMPAMLATYMLPDDTAVTIHRTFITLDGKKANIKSPKKILPALRKMTGGAIRLFEPVEGMIGIAEGIETALAVHEQTNLPIWSAVSSTLMEGFEPPKNIKHVMIFADYDLNFAGQKAAYILANKLVRNKIEVEVHMPRNPGDFLDQIKTAVQEGAEDTDECAQSLQNCPAINF
jgi:putative DNA primase/helicase